MSFIAIGAPHFQSVYASKKKCLSFLSLPPRLLYQQQSMWMAMFWLSQTTCLYTTTPNMEGELAALTPQKVRPLLIWKMVGTHLHAFLICNAFFAPFFFPHTTIFTYFSWFLCPLDSFH